MEQEYRDLQNQSGGEDWNNRRPASAGPGATEDFAQMRESLRQAQSDAERARVHSEQLDSDIEQLRKELHSHGRGAWVAAILLIALMGAGAYGYYMLNGHSSMLARLPGVQKSVDSLSRDLTGTQAQLTSWATNWDGLTGRVDQLEKGLGANLKAAKDFATVQSAKVQQQVQSEMDNRTQAMDTKLSHLQSLQQNDQVQIAELKQEVTTDRNEARQQLASAQAENGREFSNVRDEVNQTHDNLSAVAHNLDRQRVEFEVDAKQSRQVAPGLAVTVSKTDVAHQQVDGYMQLIPEGRFLWVHSQGIEQPMLFHSQDDQRTYEVVFTRVGADSAVGYVLTPRWPEVAVPMADDNSAPQPSAASIH